MTNSNDKIFCKNFVNDVKNHYHEYDYIYYNKRCDLFKNLDCKQYYKSDQTSLKLVETKCHSISSNDDFDHTSSRQGHPALGYTDSDSLDPTPLRWTSSIDDNSDL